MPEVDLLLSTLSLSQKNLQHGRKVDYYGAKLKRQTVGSQWLYLLCYLQTRWQQALERIADGFVHHVRQTKQKAKDYAQEAVFKDWQKQLKMSARQLKYCTCSLMTALICNYRLQQ